MKVSAWPANTLNPSAECGHCKAQLAEITTGQLVKGAFKVVKVDPVPDVAGTYAATLASTGKYVGNEVAKLKRPAALALGVPLYTDHAKTCTKRGTNHRST